MSLSREQMQNAAATPGSRLKTAYVDADEYQAGEKMRVRELSAKEMAIWTRRNERNRDNEDAPSGAVFLICMGAIDDAGAKLLQAEDASWLQNESSAFVTRAAHRIMVLSGLMDEDSDDDSDGDDAEMGKDQSEPTGVTDLPTDSPSDSEG